MTDYAKTLEQREQKVFDNLALMKYKVETINGTDAKNELLTLIANTRQVLGSITGYLWLPEDLPLDEQISYIRNELNCCSASGDSDEEDILIGVLKTLEEKQNANNT